MSKSAGGGGGGGEERKEVYLLTNFSAPWLEFCLLPRILLREKSIAQ